MKTFRLKSLEVVENKDMDTKRTVITLLDGLIINREDDDGQWIIEAYTSNSYLDYFKTLKEDKNEIMIQVKISKESNEPAIFKTSIIGINEIDTQMNILFKGNIIDQQESLTTNMLSLLIEKGYQGEELVTEFRQLMQKG